MEILETSRHDLGHLTHDLRDRVVVTKTAARHLAERPPEAWDILLFSLLACVGCAPVLRRTFAARLGNQYRDDCAGAGIRRGGRVAAS